MPKRSSKNMILFPDFIDFNDPYFTSHLITYIGNKRKLLPFINEAIEIVKKKLGKQRLISLDGFSGSGVVARLLKYHSKQLWANDFEDYSELINKCYLSNRSEIDLNYLSEKIGWLNEHRLDYKGNPGFIEKNYAPQDDDHIKKNERVFYTNTNAKIIDNLVKLIIENIPADRQHFFLAPLIVEASIHANTSGVFKGFHKRDGIGHFGGRGENALFRIKGIISLEMPVFSEIECPVKIVKEDVNKLVRDKKLPEFDLVYYDPPYNQHPYGSNYFMLNFIANKCKKVEIQDGISGIVKNWKKSEYNRRINAEKAMDDLIANTNSKYILISYNNEGIIPINNFKKILKKYGKVNLMTKDYNTYRGCRNLHNRNIKVKELLWMLEKYCSPR